MNRKRLVFLLLALVGIAGIVLSAIMLISAIRFYELGRVVLYSVTAIICLEMTVLSLMKAFPKNEQ